MASTKSTTSSLVQRNERKSGGSTNSNKTKYHFNTIWSLWYCAVVLLSTAYLVYIAYKRFKMYASLPWPDDDKPYIELNAHVGLVGSAVVVMPFFIVASLMKVGNLANDGSKLGSSLSACGKDAPPILPPTTGTIRNLWIHGFPTAPFLHLVAAFCLFLPKILMDASLIRAGFMAQDNIWKTDLDVFTFQNDAFFAKRGNDSFVDEINLPIENNVAEYSDSINKRNVEVNWKSGFNHHPVKTLPSTEFFFKRMPVEKMGKRRSTEDYYAWKPFSPELIYYLMSLIVFAVRYPAVFWNTNKFFSFLFSIQLLINGAQTLLSLMAFSILYKTLVNSGANDTSGVRNTYLLNPVTALVVLALSVMVVSASSISLYVYGYQRFCRFVFRSKQRFHISYDKDPHIGKPHTSLICATVTLIGSALAYGPFLWDLTSIYKRSLNVVVLACIVSSICYIFQWIILWIFLSVKNSWTFKLRVTVARAFVSSARSIKLVNDVEMVQPHDIPEESALLIIGKGKAYAVQDSYPQKEILDVVQKLRDEKRRKGAEHDIYWLRASTSKDPKQKVKNSHQKVTFSDTVQREVYSTKNCDEATYNEGPIDSDDDTGDYAILKATSPQDDSDNTSDSSNRVEIDNPRYVDRRQILAYREANQRVRDMSPPSPILVAPDYDEADMDENSPTQSSRRHYLLESQGPMTPRSNRSNDSGMPPENHSQRSDSIASSASTNTPAENSEESGIHCVTMEMYRHRSSSVDDLSHQAELHQSPAHPSFPNFNRPALMNINSVYGYCKGAGGGGQYKIIYPSAETTLAIKRQRNMTQEIKPPIDSVYGSRKLSSFTDSVRQEARRNFDLSLPSSHSNSSGYQSSNNSANNSSGSNSAGNSPIPTHPLAPISEHPLIQSNSYDFSNTKAYGRVVMPGVDQYGYTHRIPSNNGKFTQSAQMPLPSSLPQVPMVSNPGLENLKNEIYGRTNSAQQVGNSVFGQIKGLPMNRSASLRLPVNPNVRKQYTTTLPHLLPKESYYNTNV